MLKNYTLSELGSTQVFAVIKDIDVKLLNNNFYGDLVNKVGQAIEDEFSYEENVKIIHDEKTLKSVIFPYEDNTSIFYMSFKHWDYIENEEEIRDVQLTEVTIY